MEQEKRFRSRLKQDMKCTTEINYHNLPIAMGFIIHTLKNKFALLKKKPRDDAKNGGNFATFVYKFIYGA